MGNLIKTIICFFVMQLCYSQTKTTYPSIIVIQKDTLVCFNTEQSKQIAIWNEQRKECIELRSNDNQKINQLKNINTTQTGIISNLENEVYQYKKNIEDKDKIIKLSTEEKEVLKKEIRKQRRGKWIAIFSGLGAVLTTTFILTL
jgi:hypothetical protein